MPQVTTEYYGIEGTGKTLKEAKENAGRKIKQALNGHYTPEILTYRGHAILIYREPDGWKDRLIADPERGVIAGRVWGNGNGDVSKEDLIARSWLNLAQLGWTPADGLTVPEIITDKKLQGEYRDWCKFQMRFYIARQCGLDHQQAHSFAGYDPANWEALSATVANIHGPLAPELV